METKELQITKFVDKVNALKEEMINEDNGFLFLAYEMQGEAQSNAFTAGGRMNCLAECLYTCMTKDQGLANIIIAASNAFVQSRMMEAQIAKETEEASQPKKKRRTKKSN